jgi:antitoxin ParD1/3/4
MRQFDRRVWANALDHARQPACIWDMNIPLTSELLAWLRGKVASGQFNSIEEAAVAAINDTMVNEADDMSWARPLVDEARASVGRGEFLTHDQLKGFIANDRRKLACS